MSLKTALMIDLRWRTKRSGGRGPLKIGIICPYSLTLPGGVQDQVLGLGRALRNQGIDARVLGPCDGAPPDAAVTPLGNSIPTSANGSVAPIAPDGPAQLRTVRALREERFDLLHLHEPLSPGPTHTALVMHPAPILATFHAAGESAAYKYMQPIVRSLSSRIDGACAVSEQARLMARGAHMKSDIVVDIVFNGVEVARFANAQRCPTEGPTILFLGRHEPRKGLRTLLEARSELPSNVHLWIAGVGPETEELRSHFGDDGRTHWLGRITEAEKLRRMRAASVFCAPALGGESFGIVLLEAMAASTPVVASNIEGYRAVVRDGKDALLVPPGEAGALAQALRTALFDEVERNRVIDSGQERCHELSMANLADIYVDKYQAMLANVAT